MHIARRVKIDFLVNRYGFIKAYDNKFHSVYNIPSVDVNRYHMDNTTVHNV